MSALKRGTPLCWQLKLNQWSVITWKWCEIGCKWVLLTDRKSHTGFPLVWKSLTLNDLELHSSCYFALFCQIIQLWRSVTWNWLKLDPYCQQQKCIWKNLVLVIYGLRQKAQLRTSPTNWPTLSFIVWLVQCCVALWATAELLLLTLCVTVVCKSEVNCWLYTNLTLSEIDWDWLH